MRELSIETLQPARVDISGQKQNIVFCASPAVLSNAVSSNEGTAGISVDSLILNLLYSLKSEWEKAPGFEGTTFSIAVTANADSVLQTSKYDWMVSLDRMEVKNTYNGEYSGMEYAYYWEWEAFMHVYYTVEWSVRSKSGRELDRYTERDLLLWSSGIQSSHAGAILNLPGISDAWWDMGIVLAQNYTKRLTPQWKKENRNVYIIGKYLQLSEQASTAVQNNGYTRAFNIWEDMLISCRKKGQKKRKSKISHNMAVACEYANMLNESLYWVQKSINYHSTPINRDYLYQIKERIEQSKILDQQINH
jgi:hypothetical protein